MKKVPSKKHKVENINDIPPEMIAQIVRHHILPMFDMKKQNANSSSDKPTSIYDEMTLADRLEFELCSVRETIGSLEDKLKLSDLYTSKLELELKHTKLLNRKSKTTIKRLQ